MHFLGALSLVGTMSCFLTTISLLGQESVVRRARPSIPVEVVTISDFTSSRSAIGPKHGSFILTLINRVRSGPADLTLESPDAGPMQASALATAMHLDTFPKTRRLDATINATPGTYRFRRKATRQVLLTLTIE